MSNYCVLAMLFAAAFASVPSRGQDHMEHSFNNPEEWAKRFDGPERDAWQLPDRVLATLDVKPGQLVADIGSGTGYFSVRLAKLPAAPKVYG
ncbi:MAG TPA: hypothetical protein VKG25_20590, partial [Bryobacteraceae bacterium]|nr:hypothetical protein [Bryobacteraceae bacterium]